LHARRLSASKPQCRLPRGEVAQHFFHRNSRRERVSARPRTGAPGQVRLLAQASQEALTDEKVSARMLDNVDIGSVPELFVYCSSSFASSASSVSVLDELVEEEEELLVELVDELVDELSELLLSVGGGPPGGGPPGPRSSCGISPVSDEVLNLAARSFRALACCVSPLSAAVLAASSSLVAIEAVVSLNFVGSLDCRLSNCCM
jgi:hypothetical protein